MGLEQQIRYRGPVLLDRMAERPLAFFGLGDEIRGAAERRADVLRSLDIEPGDPERLPKLREAERQAIGREMAGRSGRTFVADVPSTFQGRVEATRRGADGTPYAVIGDASRLLVVEAKPEPALKVGQNLGIERGPGGSLLVRALGLDRDR